MIKLLPGVTHALVVVPLKEEAEITKVYAYVNLFFGPGDENSICGIRYVRGATGKLSWESPMYPKLVEGKKVNLPIFRGRILKEICELSSEATNKVKRHFGKAEFGKSYRVLEKEVIEEI